MIIKTIIHWIKQALFKRRFFPSAKPFVYVALGDSTVEGIGASSPDNAFASLVFFAIRQEIKNATFYNLGKSGAQVKDVIASQLVRAIELQPDLITISVGFNDIKRRTRPKTFEEEFNYLLNQLSQKTNATIVVNNIPDLSLTLSVPRMVKLYGRFMIRKLNNVIESHTKAIGAILVDIHAQSKTFRGYKELVSSDGLHPSDLGYALWGNAIISSIRHLISDQFRRPVLTR